MKEIEIRNRDTGAGGDAETNPNNNNNSSRSAGMNALFNEDKDDLDAYLIRFERACTPFEVLGYYRVKPWMYINDSQTTSLMTVMC